MIIKALADYYQRLLNDPNSNIAPPGFERKAIPFLLVLRKDGSLANIRDTRTGEGKKNAAREYLVPQGEKKTSGIKANLLWDSTQYVLGLPKSEKPKDTERAAEALQAFKDRLNETFSPDFNDDGIHAVRHFLDTVDSAKIAETYPDIWKELLETGPNLSFVLEDDTELIAQRPKVLEILHNSIPSETNTRICSITGTQDIPAVLHPAIKGVWNAQTMGANIVSFNSDAYCSYGRTHADQGLNTAIGEQTAFAYTTALNHLLRKGSMQRMQIGDASTVFWAKENCPFEDEFSFFLGEPPKGEENASFDKIRSLLSAVKTGIRPAEDELPFYVLGLAPNASRLSVRFWQEGKVREIKERIVQHFDDLEIVRASFDREYLSLFQLLLSTASAGKADNIPPNLGGDLFRAVMDGTPYPRTLLSNALIRCKAEQKVTHARAAIIKAILTRDNRFNRTQTKEEIHMALDKETTNIGYVLGRLFAVLERIQEQAQSGLNKTIRDTYFGAACSSPLVTFKRLQDLAIHHLAKIRNSGKSTVWLDKLMQEVIDKISSSGIPQTLMIEDQGRFAVGYYHQRQDFFTKNETKNEEGEE